MCQRALQTQILLRVSWIKLTHDFRLLCSVGIVLISCSERYHFARYSSRQMSLLYRLYPFLSSCNMDKTYSCCSCSSFALRQFGLVFVQLASSFRPSQWPVSYPTRYFSLSLSWIKLTHSFPPPALRRVGAVSAQLASSPRAVPAREAPQRRSLARRGPTGGQLVRWSRFLCRARCVVRAARNTGRIKERVSKWNYYKGLTSNGKTRFKKIEDSEGLKLPKFNQ